MWWTPILEFLTDLGTAAVSPLWLPVVAWTALALPLWVLLERTKRLHPRAEYRLSQVLLFALPLGLVAAGLTSLLPASPPVDAGIEVPQAALPPLEVAAPQAGETTPSGATTAAPGWHWIQALGLATILGLAVGVVQLGRLVLDALAVDRVRASVEGSPDDSIQARASQLAEQLGVGRLVRVRLAPSAAVPVTLGGLRPTILLPPGLAKQDKALRMTLRHELIHIRRYDDLAHLVERFVAALFATHPLVGRLRSRIEASREQACDAAVLSENSTSLVAYARLLATFAEENARAGRLGALSLSESSSALTNRLAAMRSTGPQRLSSVSTLTGSILGLGLLLTLGMVGCSDTVAPSSTSTHDLTSSPENNTIWAPITDARAAGNTWLEHFNEGRAEQSYEDIPLSEESLTRAEWADWVEKRHSKLGAMRSQRLFSTRLPRDPGASNSPIVRLRYALEYESGTSCRVILTMALVETTWKVAQYGTTSCSGVLPPGMEGPKGAHARMVLGAPQPPSSSHKLPVLVGGWERLHAFPRAWKAVQKHVPNPEVARKAQGQVLVEFTVETDGQVTNVHVKENRGRPFDLSTSAQVEQNPEDLLYPEARQAIRSTSFKPGQVEGTPTRTRIQLPVSFNCVTMRAAGLEKPCLPGE